MFKALQSKLGQLFCDNKASDILGMLLDAAPSCLHHPAEHAVALGAVAIYGRLAATQLNPAWRRQALVRQSSLQEQKGCGGLHHGLHRHLTSTLGS